MNKARTIPIIVLLGAACFMFGSSLWIILNVEIKGENYCKQTLLMEEQCQQDYKDLIWNELGLLIGSSMMIGSWLVIMKAFKKPKTSEENDEERY